MYQLTITGLGPGGKEHMSMATIGELKRHEIVYLRTANHPGVEFLKEEGINFETFDKVYEEKEDFQAVYEEMANIILTELERKDVIYAVPGHPYVAEKSVQILLEKCEEKNIKTKVYPAMSFIDAMLMALKIDAIDGFKLLDALQLDTQEPDTTMANIITQVYDPLIASEVKLKLMEYYNDEQEIIIVKNAGIPEIQKVEKIPLYELDRLKWIDHLTSIYIPRIDTDQQKYYNVNNLVEIMEILRSEDGCPWDREQTHDSIKPNLIEESYEVLEAIELKDDVLLEEELGDLLLQVVFHSQIASERQAFNFREVIDSICRKLVYRHPHVFEKTKVDNYKEALSTWEAQKEREKQISSTTESMLIVPKGLPALMRADKLQKKAADVGFDWDHIKGVIKKLHEELGEVLEAYYLEDPEKIKEEIGDLIFATVNLSRFLGVNPEDALNLTSNKFIDRFKDVENMAKAEKKNLKEMTLEEMDILWEKAKTKEKNN